jgi:hypothetical protein
VSTPTADTDRILAQIAGFCPTDFVIHDFTGERLTLHGGRDGGGWRDLAVVFDEVIYMGLPVYLNTVTIWRADEAARAALIERCNCDPATDGFHLFELIEDADWPEGRRSHLVAAGSIRLQTQAEASEQPPQ